MTILDKAKPVSDDEPYIKAVIHGGPGVGKTYFAASAPNPVFIDWERSTETLRYSTEFKDTPVFRPTHFKEVWDFVKEAPKKYSTVVLDTATSMQVAYNTEYMEGVEKATKRDKYLPYQGDFRRGANELTDFFLTLQEMPINLIVITHSDYIRDEETKKVISIEPLLTPAVKKNLSAFINVIAYLEKKSVLGKPERTMYLNSTHLIMAKNRLGITAESIKNPTFQGVFSAHQS